MAKRKVSQEEFIENAQEGLADILKPYQQRLNKRQRMADFVRQCIRCIDREDFVQLDELLKSRMADDIQKEAGLKAGKDLYGQLREFADGQVERYRIQLIEDLENQAAEAELPLEIDFPRFSVLKGIEGEIDFHERKTVINGKALKSIDPRRILSAVTKVKRQLYDRPYDPQTFIDGLYKTYCQILEEEDWAPGHAVPILQFYLAHVISLQSKSFFQNMDKGRFKGYSANQFAVDIWCFFEAGTGGTSNGHALQLRPGRNKSLWLIDSDGERRQITAISFQERQ